jgi:hypothetical protein
VQLHKDVQAVQEAMIVRPVVVIVTAKVAVVVASVVVAVAVAVVPVTKADQGSHNKLKRTEDVTAKKNEI